MAQRVDVNTFHFAASILWLWIGFVGAVFVVEAVASLIAYLVGHGADSFVDLFLRRYTRTLAVRSVTLCRQIGYRFWWGHSLDA